VIECIPVVSDETESALPPASVTLLSEGVEP
jgi:hypothetical protein